MKILMAAMSMGLGGAETHVLELSRALAARGHEVFVASSGGVYARELAKYGIGHVKIPLSSKKAALKAAFLLSRLMERERFDIVHAHARIPAFICERLSRKYGFAFVTTVHFDFRVNPFFRKLTFWGEHTFAVSEDIAESTAAKYGIERGKITVINNGIDTERFSPANSGEGVRKRLGLAGRKVIMYLGRLDGDSFLPAELLLCAAEEIYRAQKDARFLIVGGGKKHAELAERARRLNEKLGLELAFLPGGTAKPEEYFAACDIFVGPSRSALEALASGKPAVIAGNFGMLGVFSPENAGEALRTNFCCRGSPPATAERVCREVLRLLSLGAGEAASLAAYGREFTEKHYGTARMTAACEAEYRALLAARGKSVVLCGYYGAGNIGDEAMLGALISSLKRAENIGKITVISANPEKTRASFGTEAVARLDFAGIKRALAESRVLIFGGGNILQDKTSTRSLVYYAHLARLARAQGCKVAFSANGIGPVLKKGNFALVKKALLCADYISMREEDSRALASRLTGRDNIYLSGELAFVPALPPRAHRGGYFAVFPKSVENLRLRELTKFCACVKRKCGIIPIFAPMHAREDERICRILAEKTGGVYMSLENERAARLLTGGAEFTVCMRLHAAVFSAAAGVPAILVCDGGKLAAFARASGLPALGTGVGASELLRAAHRALAARKGAKKLLGKFAGEQRRLAEAEMRRLLEFLGD